MKEMICRLCLQTIVNNNCRPVEETLLKSLKLNINISKQNVMCIECVNCLRVFSNFTPGCAYLEDEPLPLSDLDNGVKLDPELIETTTNLKTLMETETKCGFCTNAHGREDLISLEDSKENKFMVNMLKQYIKETNLKNTEELLSCETCLESLDGVILKCLEVEEKISKYIELEGTDDKGQIELREVQRLMFRPILKSEIEPFGVNALENRSDTVQEYTTMAEDEIKYEKEIRTAELIIKTEDDDITSEQSGCDIPDIKSEEKGCDGFQEPFNESKTPNDLHISVVKSEKRNSKDPIKQHPLTHKNPSEMKMFKCAMCQYEAKTKHCLRRHLLTHKSPSKIKKFKCELCPYEGKQSSHLKAHLLTHKHPSEIKMFKCELCSYGAKLKYNLKKHLLIHKSPSELMMFKCDLCSYEAKQKNNLKEHLLIHKSPSEIKMFKCTMCPYEAKRKVCLRRHLLTHKSPSEIEMFKCAMCPYEAKWKLCLRRHLLTHRSPSEIEMFKCAMCPYEAKRKLGLTRHILTHKSPSEIKMFKCELCAYEGKQKSYLKTHSLIHKSPSVIKMFKCELCSYEAKLKYTLKKHLMIHKSPSELMMFKCEVCSYETKRKDRLREHLLSHYKV